MSDNVDFDSPIDIAPNVTWVGRRGEDELLNCNSYLLSVERGSRQTVHFLIDPGSPKDFRVTSDKIIKKLGSLNKISVITINHQDPDVILSAPTIMKRYAPNSTALMTENTWRLVAHTGISKERVRLIEQFQGELKFKGMDHGLILVPTPFCHFTGAFAIYDTLSRTLFTGDLFGGVTLSKEMFPLIAVEDNWKGIKMFHELYMPCNNALKHAISQIKKLDPPVEIIAPQHGSIIQGDLLKEFMSRMERLPVGADLLTDHIDKETWEAWNDAANEILEDAGQLMGKAIAIRRITDSRELMDMCAYENKRIEIKENPKFFIEGMVIALTEKEAPKMANQIKVSAILTCEAQDLPSPNIDISTDSSEIDEEFMP